MASEPKTSSLRYMQSEQQRIFAHCSNAFKCSHSAQLQMDMLIQRLGWEFDIVVSRAVFRRRLICTLCNARFPELIILPYPEGQNSSGQSHSNQATLSVADSTMRSMAFNVEHAGRIALENEGAYAGPRRRRKFK